MTLPLWGSLEKSADDAETIEQAIARLVAEHEADPTAHLGSGESLEMHKAEDVIDHPVGSVLADKWTMTEFDFTTLFENLSVFATTGNVASIFPGVRIYSTASGSGGRSRVVVPLEDQNFTFFPNKSFLFQFVFSADTYQSGVCWFNFGYTGSQFGKSGVGLKIDNEVATFYTSDYDGANGEELSWPGFTDVSDRFVVRIQFISGDSFVSFFANGVLIGTLPWPIDPDASDVMGVYFATQKNGATDANLFLNYFFFSLGV